MNKKRKSAGEPEGGVIMEFKELIDGNFMMILNGNKLKEKVDLGTFSIDLNSPITGGKLSPLAVLLFHKIKTFLRGDLPEIIKNKILDLNSDEKRINAFVKKYGFDAIEVPTVRNYFSELVKRARDKDSDKSDECKKKLMSHTDKKVRIIHDVSIPNLVGYLEKIEEEAEMFYPEAREFCWDCRGKKSSYSSCEKKARCEDLLSHIKDHLPNWTEWKINKCLRVNTRSKYVEEKFMKKLGVDRRRAEEILRYAKKMKKLAIRSYPHKN